MLSSDTNSVMLDLNTQEIICNYAFLKFPSSFKEIVQYRVKTLKNTSAIFLKLYEFLKWDLKKNLGLYILLLPKVNGVIL